MKPMTSNNSKSSSSQVMTMNPHLKRMSLLLVIAATYLIVFKDTKILRILVPDNFTATSKQTVRRKDNNPSQSASILRRFDSADADARGEPYLNRWQRRFSTPTSINNGTNNHATNQGAYFFFKHMRKAGGTSLRSYFRDVFQYHGVNCTRDDYGSIKKRGKVPEILYVEHEFQTMDSECPLHDPRWERSLRVVTLRHPIERHMSEFFFSGPGTKFYIDRQQLYTNETYTKQLSTFLNEQVPLWIKQEGGGKTFLDRYGEMDGRLNMYFGRFYTNNFQLRAMAGCSSSDCLQRRHAGNLTPKFEEEMAKLHPLRNKNTTMYSTSVPLCTQYFHKDHGLYDPCAKGRMQQDECKLGCDGPCFYPSVAWGPLDRSDVARALSALEAFDIVLLTETFDDPDQSAFLADVLGVPRDAEFALTNHNVTNYVVQKRNKHEKTHFYRDLLAKLSPRSLEMLMVESELEVELYERAVEVNSRMTKEWKRETNWKERP
ncbi:hypothetical protein HJC23_009215 [Cyclotella cryptica]|uniref:Sulfotransferase domain-containing protein n=1 Tax=Cyclotella cryptica TaxID=29204 RepID=A0ABD3P5M9_9STRA|eukprot:CCRYP_018280-RB/>CCRYP_018280-RB protein AED:0.12 eAED:0.12 QI:318/1/1/1/0.5/0.33/3/1662/488